MKTLFAFLGMSSLILSGCSLLDMINGKSSTSHIHTYVDHAQVDPTCTKEGTEAYASCEGCDKLFDINHEKEISKVVSIPKIAHNFIDYDREPATCDHEGHVAYAECSMCHKIFINNHKKEVTLEDVMLPQSKHNFVDYDAKEPTCTEEGWIAHSECSYCHKVTALDHVTELTDYKIAKVAHTYVDHPAVEPSCEHAGNVAYATCSVCGKVFDSSHEHEITDDSYLIAQLPHDLVHHEAVLFDHIEYWECNICHQKFADEDATEVVDDVSKAALHDILNENVKAYLSATTEAETIAALGQSTPFNDQVKKTISWKNQGVAPYRVEVSMSENFASYKTYSADSNSLELPGTLIPGQRYYYRVYDLNDNQIVSLDGFEVDGTYSLRTLSIDGCFNVRDEGGWTAKGGNKILYNKIIRGGRLDYISNKGKDTFVNELGIKTEIDLRGGSDGFNVINSASVDYRKYGMNQYTMIVPGYVSPSVVGKPTETHYGYDTSTAASIKNIFETLADENAYPVYYHCNAGADRTGTVSYLINGLLGVSYEDLVKDFELTTFSSQGNRFRSCVEGDHWVTTGEMAGIYECDTDNYVAFGKLHELISTNYAQENGQLCSAIEFYLKKVCGISDETIAAVRRNLLGKDVEFDPVVVPVDKTFTPSNGNMTYNPQLSWEKGTFHGSECYKFIGTDYTDDHYIFNNLSMINAPEYKTFHFEIYIESSAPRWNTHQGEDKGARFHMSVKPSGGSTNNMAFSEDVSSDTPNSSYHLDLDAWNIFELDISSYSDLIRFAFYLPYGTSEKPPVAYLRNVYVSEDPMTPESPTDTTFTPTNGNWTIDSQLDCVAGTFHGSECYKFTTNGNTQDHYIKNNLALIEDDSYTIFHFEIYIADASAKWNVDSGCRFAMSIKPTSGSSTRIEYSEDYTSSSGNYRHCNIDEWNTFEMDITGLTSLSRFAFYLPYGSSERPVEIYLRNVYVSETSSTPEPGTDTTFTPTNGNWIINSQLDCATGTFHGSECYKFTTNGNTQDHYIQNNLDLIEDDNYTTFHFEIYIADASAKWNVDSGERFAMSIKPNGGSTNRIGYSEDYSSTTGNYRHCDIDEWNTLEVDITGLTNLIRFAFYLPYGSSERPVEIYLRNVYVY